MSEPSHETAEPKAFQVTRREAGCAAFLLLFVVMAELGLRFLGIANPIIYEKDFQAGYVLRANQQVNLAGNEIVINRWNVRDPRSFDEKPEDVYRVLVLGDSVTWGGVTIMQHELFTSRIEALMPGTEVINAGVNGYSVYRMAKFYEYTLSGLMPDVVVLVVIPRDFTRPTLVELLPGSAAFPLEKPRTALEYVWRAVRVRLYRATKWKLLEPPPESTMLREKGEEASIKGNLNALESLHENSDGKKVVVVFAPVLPEAPDADRLEEFKAAVEAMGVPVIDLNQMVKPDPAWFMDGVHLTAAGHGVIAPYLAAALQRDGYLPGGADAASYAARFFAEHPVNESPE